MGALQRKMMDRRNHDRLQASMENRDADDIDDEIKVLPIQKKVHAKNPGSSPEQRSGIEGIDYVVKHGKAPLIEKRDIKLRQSADIYGIEQGAAAAKQCAISLLAQLKAACGGDIDRLGRLVKLVGFVNSTPDFIDQPKVINGASDFMVAALGEKGRHARSAVSAASLPFGVAVEIEAIFTIK